MLLLLAVATILGLDPPTVFERSCKFTRKKMDRTRHLETWGGDPKQSIAAYEERKSLIPKELQEWFEPYAREYGGSNILAFLLGYQKGTLTKIYFYDSNTGLHLGKELRARGERKYVPVHFKNYPRTPAVFVRLFGEAPGDGRVRYDITPSGMEIEQAVHLTMQYTELFVRDKREELLRLLKLRHCNISQFEEWYADHQNDRITCLGLESQSEAVTIYHANAPYYDDATCEATSV